MSHATASTNLARRITLADTRSDPADQHSSDASSDHVTSDLDQRHPYGLKLDTLDAVLRALLKLRDADGQGAAARVLRYAVCYLQMPATMVQP